MANERNRAYNFWSEEETQWLFSHLELTPTDAWDLFLKAFPNNTRKRTDFAHKFRTMKIKNGLAERNRTVNFDKPPETNSDRFEWFDRKYNENRQNCLMAIKKRQEELGKLRKERLWRSRG